MNRVVLFILLAAFLVFVKGQFSPIDSIVGTWASNNENRKSLILNEDGTGSSTFFTGNGMEPLAPAWKSVGNNIYNIDYPRVAVLSADNMKLMIGEHASFVGNGFVGPWKGAEKRILAQGFTAEEFLYIFGNNTGFYYLKCKKNPSISQVLAFSWKQLDDESYSFYNYAIGILFELSGDVKTQTILNTGTRYTGEGLTGTWNRKELYTLGDGTRVKIQRIFKEDGTAKQYIYKTDGTIHSVRHMTWFRLIDGYYCIIIDDLPLGKAVLNDDGTLTYYDYHTFTQDTVFHKI